MLYKDRVKETHGTHIWLQKRVSLGLGDILEVCAMLSITIMGSKQGKNGSFHLGRWPGFYTLLSNSPKKALKRWVKTTGGF